MPHSFTVDDLRDLSNWAQLWLSDVAHYEWGFNRDSLEPWNPAAVASHAESGQYAFDELLQRGPMFCAAVGQWHDKINAAKPTSDPVEYQVGFIAVGPQRAIPVDRGVSAHSLAAEWIGEKLGMAIVGRKPWNAAVAAAGPVATSADYQLKVAELVRKLYLHFDGVELLRVRMEDELSRVRAAAGGQSPADAGETRTVAANSPSDISLAALLSVFTNGVSDDRINQAAALLSDASLTVDQKLTKIDALLPFPPTASAKKLGIMINVSANAVKKSEWWVQNRKGKLNAETDIRRRHHQERSKLRDDGPKDDEE